MVAENADLALIQKTELFSNLSKDEIDFIVSRSAAQNLQKGGILFSSGETAKQFYILTNGSIRVYKNRDDGSQDEMAIFAAGDTIGDFDFARGAAYDAYAEAAEDSRFIVFPCSGYTMESLAGEEPRTVCSILLNAVVLMTRRIKSINRLILENMSWVQELHRRAYEDSGTGLWKQSLINDEIVAALNAPSALIMLKPDRFKILVDSRGHAAGDEAMIRIAIILKNITRQIRQGWALRFKSNEVGLILNDSDEAATEKVAKELFEAIAAMEPVPAKDGIPEFRFSATITWALWPFDNAEWESLFQGNYACLLDSWRAGGERIVRYVKTEEQ